MSDRNKRLIDKIKQAVASKKLSDVTETRWIYVAEDFLSYIDKKNISFSRVTSATVKEYLSYKSRKVSGNTLKTIFYMLKAIFKMWGKKEIFEDLEDDVPKGHEPERPYFTIDETKQMIDAGKERFKKRGGDFIGLRDLTMLLISVDTGTRRIQIQRLNRENFTKQKKLKIPPSFKGGRWTTRTLRKETVRFLEKYLEERKKRLDIFAEKPDSPLFIDTSNKRISPEAMGYGFGQIKKMAGIDKPGGGFHGFRRSKTTRLHKGGLSEIEIVRVMGWKEGSKEPHIYAQLDEDEVQDKASKADELMDLEEF